LPNHFCRPAGTGKKAGIPASPQPPPPLRIARPEGRIGGGGKGKGCRLAATAEAFVGG